MITATVTPKLPDFPDRLDFIPRGTPRIAKSRQVKGMENFLLNSTSGPEVGSPFAFISLILSLIFVNESSLFPIRAFFSSLSVSGRLRLIS